MKEVNAKIDSLVDSQILTEQNWRRTDERFEAVNAKIDSLVDSQTRTDENVRRTEENVRRTDESLRNLIAVVDRHISPGRTWTLTAEKRILTLSAYSKRLS